MESGNRAYGLTLLHHCGGGAYGDVYRCRDASGKELALKIIEKQKLGSGWERELKGITRYRPLSEATPGLLKIYHVGEDERSFYYTMELADNAGDEEHYIPDTLAHRLTAGALPAETLLDMLRQLLQAIQTLHEAGYAHRDIKPENILFVHGKPVLADLGLVAPISGTMTQFAGTLDFLPPEERAGEGRPDSRESRQCNDLYAFGKIVYCCVTGKCACDFPVTPGDMPLDLRRKLLFRLCLRLCDREAIRRLTKLREVVSEFARIERICRHGEKWTDKVSFGIMSGARGLFFVFRKVSGGLRRHWILSLLCIVLLCGAVWYFRPEPPFDITQVKSKTYTHAELGLEMEIPVEWEVLSGDTVLKMLNEMQEENEELSEVDRNRMEFLRMLLEQRCDYIVCGYDEEFMENIAIQTVDVPGDILWDAPDDEIRLGMQQLFRGDLGFDMKIHEFRRQSLAGQRCIFVDLSQSSEARINNYVFALEDKCVSIALAVREENFPRRREEFDSVLSTLRFVK